MSAALNHYQFKQELARFDAAEEALFNQLGYLAQAEMAELARRFPTREISLSSGMGTTTIFISRRANESAFDYMASSADDDCPITDWACRKVKIAPNFWPAMQEYFDRFGRDPGLGDITFINGICTKGFTP